jgi:hypothetical protein
VSTRVLPPTLSVLLALLVGVEIAFFHHGRWPGFFAVVGIASTGALFVVAKLLLAPILCRREERDDW